METLLRRLLWCFGTTRHRRGKPRHRHDIPRGGSGTDGTKRSFFRPTRPSGAAAARFSPDANVEPHETPTLRRRRWLRLRLRGMNRVFARSPPRGMTTTRAIEPKPATTDAATIQASGACGGGGNQELSFCRERAAAATIQAHFRGHLARQAFRALRSLVKLQAFARGAYVRKQANVAIRCMKVLVRLQVRVHSRQLLLRPRPAKGEQQ